MTLDALALRSQVPTLVVRPGMILAGRVAERHGQMGLLMLAGAALSAKLPDEVPAGAKLRLVVSEANAERIVLRIADQAQTPPPALAVALPLPGGEAARVYRDESEAEGEENDAAPSRVSLVYDSPRLGPLDLVLTLEDGRVTAGVRAAAGAPFEEAQAAAADLERALGEATGRPALVSVTPRREPLDLYA